MVLSREQEVLIERMMDEWEEEQSDAKLRAEIEADKELWEMLSTMEIPYAWQWQYTPPAR